MKQFSNYLTVFFVSMLMVSNSTQCGLEKNIVSMNNMLNALKNETGLDSSVEILRLVRLSEDLSSEDRAYADLMLGTIYYQGSDGAPEDFAEAFKLLNPLVVSKKVDGLNYCTAKFLVSDMYGRGNGVSQNEDKAVTMLKEIKESDEFGQLPAQYKKYINDVLSKNSELIEDAKEDIYNPNSRLLAGNSQDA
jgi:TPR repeat protein